jgi:hypothetical protein
LSVVRFLRNRNLYQGRSSFPLTLIPAILAACPDARASPPADWCTTCPTAPGGSGAEAPHTAAELLYDAQSLTHGDLAAEGRELTDFVRWLTHTHVMRWDAHRGGEQWMSRVGKQVASPFQSTAFPVPHSEHAVPRNPFSGSTAFESCATNPAGTEFRRSIPFGRAELDDASGTRSSENQRPGEHSAGR